MKKILNGKNFFLIGNNKAVHDMELTEALNQYEQCFGERYFFYIGFVKSDQEIIEEIENCIKTGKKQKEPRYDEDKLY